MFLQGGPPWTRPCKAQGCTLSTAPPAPFTDYVVQVLAKHSGPLSIKDLSTLTGIKVDDIIYTLQSMQLVQYYKGQHVLCAAPAVIEWCVLSSRASQTESTGRDSLPLSPKLQAQACADSWVPSLA